jgi:hypothetical protein
VQRQVAVVIFKTRQVNLGLKDGDCDHKLGILDCPKEDPAAALVIKVDIELLLQTEI